MQSSDQQQFIVKYFSIFTLSSFSFFSNNYGSVWNPCRLIARPSKATSLVAACFLCLPNKLAQLGKEILAHAGEPNRLSGMGKVRSLVISSTRVHAVGSRTTAESIAPPQQPTKVRSLLTKLKFFSTKSSSCHQIELFYHQIEVLQH